MPVLEEVLFFKNIFKLYFFYNHRKEMFQMSFKIRIPKYLMFCFCGHWYFSYPDQNGNKQMYKSMLCEFNSASVETMSDRWISNLFNLLLWCKCWALRLDTVIYSLENSMSADIPNMDYLLFLCVTEQPWYWWDQDLLVLQWGQIKVKYFYCINI